MQLRQLAAHLHAQRRIEIGQRLVEQEDFRIANDRTADRHALALATRELAGLAPQQRLELQHLGRNRRPFSDHLFRVTGHAQAKADILGHRHMRIERIGLEHHGHAALGRADLGHVLAADRQRTGGDVLEAGNHPEQRGLAAAGRADKDAELAILDVEIDALDDAERAELFLDVAQAHISHGSCLP